MGIQGKAVDQVLGSGLAQGKSFLLNKFSTLNQKVKQTKTNVNIGNFKPLGKLGTFSKPEVKVNFLKPNLHVNLWKSDSSLETHDGNKGSAVLKVLNDKHSEEISSDSDSYNSDEQPCSGSRENVDYVLPSCGIVASAPRLASRSQSIGSVELAVPSVIRVTGCDDKVADSLSVGPGWPVSWVRLGGGGSHSDWLRDTYWCLLPPIRPGCQDQTNRGVWGSGSSTQTASASSLLSSRCKAGVFTFPTAASSPIPTWGRVLRPWGKSSDCSACRLRHIMRVTKEPGRCHRTLPRRQQWKPGCVTLREDKELHGAGG